MSVTNRPLSIVCIAADLIPGKLGGAELHCVEVIKRLSKRHQIHLFVGSNTRVKKDFASSVYVYPISYPQLSNLYGIFFIIWGYFICRHKLKHHQFDLIWAKQSFPQAILAVLLKQTFHRPVYITAQNPMLHTEELVIKGRLLKPFTKLLTGFITPLISWAYQRADMVAAVSTYSRSLAEKLRAVHTQVIPNGINLNKTKKSSRHDRQFTIITNSALIPRNGVDILIDAVALLPQSLHWRLLIAGDGPKKDELKSQISKHKLENKIKLLGRVNNKNIPKLLSRADIFVRPSRFEGFGVAFIEAMGQKVPVVATPVGGIVDFIFHRRTGLLVKPENPKALAKAMLLLQKDSQLKRRLITNAYRLVKKSYTWDKIALQVETAFSQLCR